MKSTWKALAVTVGAVALVAWACDDGGNRELTLEEYFRQYEAIEDKYAERYLQPSKIDPDAPLDEQQEQMAKELADFIKQLEGSTVELDALNEPQDVRASHEEVLAHLRVATAAGTEFLQSSDGLNVATPDSNAAASFGRMVEALIGAEESCEVLDDIADDNGISAELRC